MEKKFSFNVVDKVSKEISEGSDSGKESEQALYNRVISNYLKAFQAIGFTVNMSEGSYVFSAAISGVVFEQYSALVRSLIDDFMTDSKSLRVIIRDSVIIVVFTPFRWGLLESAFLGSLSEVAQGRGVLGVKRNVE